MNSIKKSSDFFNITPKINAFKSDFKKSTELTSFEN